MKHSMRALVGVLCLAAHSAGEEVVDHAVVDRLRDEGFNRSRVMEWASWMTDVYGPRLANTPGYDAAAEWARDRFAEFGLENASVDTWGEYGTSWSNEYVSVHMMAPSYMPLIAYAKPWTRGTPGRIEEGVVRLDAASMADEEAFDAHRESVAGKVVFIDPLRPLRPNFTAQAVRLPDAELDDMATLRLERPNEPAEEQAPPKRLDRRRLIELLDEVGAAALVTPGQPNVGPMDKCVVLVSGDGPGSRGAKPALTTVVVAAEHYNRMMRILDKGLDVEMEIEVRNAIREDDRTDANVLAELSGSDMAGEIVMIGGHYDAEPAGTGATDNASGAAAVMEAMRLLKAIDAKPRRTIRAALWGAEESGLLGSRAYVRKHFGDRETGERLPDHEKLSVYFNMDWYGRFRGIFLQGNDRARPIFEAWMRPFHDVGMQTLVPGNTGGTDHMAFVEVGLPGFQFVQDDLEFFNVTFHTNMDVYDRLVPEDLMQASVILASFAYHAAMRDEMIPRSPLRPERRWHK